MKHILLFLPFTSLFTALVAVSIQIYLLIQHRRRERAEKTDLLGRYHMRETKLVDSFTIISRGYLKTDGHACFCTKQFDFCSDRCPMFQYVIHTKPMPEHSPTHAVKFRHNGLQIRARISEKGNFTLYFRKLKKNEKELK